MATKPTSKGVIYRLPKEAIPTEVEASSFIKDKSFIDQSRELAKSIYGADSQAYKTLDKFNYNGEVVIGSSPFMAAHAQDVLPHIQELKDARIAGLADLDPAFGLPLKGTYEDPSLLLQEGKESIREWTSLTDAITEDIKARSKDGRIIYPVVIDWANLRLKQADNQYGLAFRLREDAPFLTGVEEFLPENNKKTFSRVDERGVPIFEEEGYRTLYIWNKPGVCRLGLCGACFWALAGTSLSALAATAG